MKTINKKLSTIVLCVLFATMQISSAVEDLGLGAGLGGAEINNVTGGFQGWTPGDNSADLNFNGNSHVNWNTLNLNSNETLNFNAVDGASNLTILNTVNNGMSQIYGTINAKEGIGNLIISNPNGVLFDGAHFTTAGDLMITTQDMSGLSVDDLSNAKYIKMYDDKGNLIPVKIVNGSTFTVNGDYTILAPQVYAESSTIKANNLKLITANGQDYIALGLAAPKANISATTLRAMNIDGNVVITNDVGATQIADGGTINGNLTATTNGLAWFNFKNNGNKLVVNGDVNLTANNEELFLRNAEINGNLNMTNHGGFVDLGDAKVTGNANLTTTGMPEPKKYHHFVHVIGDTSIGGDLNIESSQNIHIGGYDYDAEKLADGNLSVGGDLNAHSTNGHITTTINTQAKRINYKSDNYNILTDDKAVLTADEYNFSANGYIGGIKDYDGMSADKQIVTIMENYIHIPSDIESHAYMNIAGGNIAQINTPNDAQVYIASQGDVKLTGANAGDINLTAYRKRIDIVGDDVHANNINIGPETDTLKVEFDKRDYTLNYTNIRDEKVVTVRPDEVITYELTNEPENGYNAPDKERDWERTTYLIGPDKEPVIPPVDPPVDPPVEPVTPDPVIPDGTENARNLMTQWTPTDAMQAPVNTPIAFAADLDEDEIDRAVRKNVDGSVTVVRAFPMMN